ncbi:hypothetical protein Tco_0464918 [Tanacetum coccineum]
MRQRRWEIELFRTTTVRFLPLQERRIVPKGKECVSRNVVWPGLTNGIEGRWWFILYGSNLGSIDRKCKDINCRQGSCIEPEIPEWKWDRITMDYFIRLPRSSSGNSYHSSIRCASFDALYGRKCRSPILCAEIGENWLIGPKFVQETTDKVVQIKERLKVVRDHQKSYVDNRCKPLEFTIGDQVLLKVSTWKAVVRFKKKGKLAPKYVGPL